METRNQAELDLRNQIEYGNSSADENPVTKKKSKKRERSPNADQVSAENSAAVPSSPQQNANTNTPVANQKKEKQRPETWNKLEQQIFFNALRQNGKNFESITQYFNARQKKFKADDGVYVQRSKEQIRHFYYRTWHKIIKYISIPFLKNKNDPQPRWNKKSALKLVELINQGWTTIREKGKVTRLKMPIYKVSTKSVQSDPEIAQPEEKDPVPTLINIYLEPKNENAYCRVHRLAQTPFLNVEIRTSQTLKYLIEFLENKWKNRRSQLLEKFQISQPLKPNTDTTDADAEQENEKKNNTENSQLEPCMDLLNETLVLYPNEASHKLVDIDLCDQSNVQEEQEHAESTGDNIPVVKLKTVVEGNENAAGTTTPPKTGDNLGKANGPVKTSGNKVNLVQQDLILDDETMMIDDFALIAAKKEVTTKNNFQLQVDQLRAGLTATNTKIIPDFANTKQLKDLTFGELYLSFNKPEIICLKYDWVNISNSSNNISSCSSSSIVPSTCSLDFNKNQRQRFYIDTLASVAASFLKDIQASKHHNVLQTNNHELNLNNQAPSANKTRSNAKETKLTLNYSSQNKQPSQSVTQKSPTKTMAPSNTPLNSMATQELSNNVDSVINLVDTAEITLQRQQSDEQTSKTKKLLSDLSSKARRNRQRKQVMVVNTSNNHSPRNGLLPKLNLNMDLNQISCQLNISPQSSSNNSNSVNETAGGNTASTQIVCSGPQACARQIVNNMPISLLAITPQTTSVNSPLSTTDVPSVTVTPSDPTQSYSVKSSNPAPTNPESLNLLNLAATQQSFKFMPNFLSAHLTDNSSSNSHIEENECSDLQIKQNVPLNVGTSDGLTNMSLLEMPINSTDSLFGTSANIISDVNNCRINNSNVMMQINDGSKQLKAYGDDNQAGGIVMGAFSSVNLDKNNLNHGNNEMAPVSLHKDTNMSNEVSSEFNLVHKKSDVCEWTDSMTDVSLTGILTDFPMKSPMKQSNNIATGVFNESSNSIYISMDTIMEIMPSANNRFDSTRLDDNSLMPASERVTQNLQN